MSAVIYRLYVNINEQYAFSTCEYCIASIVLSKADRSEAKLIRTSTSVCFFMASAMFL